MPDQRHVVARPLPAARRRRVSPSAASTRNRLAASFRLGSETRAVIMQLASRPGHTGALIPRHLLAGSDGRGGHCIRTSRRAARCGKVDHESYATGNSRSADRIY